MIAMQAAFKAHQKDWRRREGARFTAYRQRRRDTVAIGAAMEDFANRFLPILPVQGFRQARAEHRRGLKNIADRRLADALADVGPAMPKPVFIDFVKARAGAGDAAAARVYRDMTGDVSETRRRALDRVAAMVRELAVAVRTLRGRHDKLRQDVATVTMALRRSVDELAPRAAMETARLKALTRRSAADLRTRIADIAERLARRLDDTNHRIHVENGLGRVDRWQPGPIEREIVVSPRHRRVFEQYASMQTGEVEALRDDVRLSGAARKVGHAVLFDAARSGIGNPRVLRWANEPEVVAALHDVDPPASRSGACRTGRCRSSSARCGCGARSGARHGGRSHGCAVGLAGHVDGGGPASKCDNLAWATGEVRAARQGGCACRDGCSVDGSCGAARGDGAARTRRRCGTQLSRPVAHRDRCGATGPSHRPGRDRPHRDRRGPCNDPPGGADARADQVLAHALTDPLTLRIRDEKAAEQAEWKDWKELRARLGRQNSRFPFDQRWIDLWRDVLDERPLDTTVARAERNRAIDHEVAAAMMHEGATLMQTRSAIMQFSPTSWALKSRERLVYVDEQVDALDYVLRQMTPKQREKAGPKPVSAVLLAQMRALPRDPYDERLDDHFSWVSGELPLRPRSFANIAVTAKGRTSIDGLEVHFADVGGSGKGNGEPASSDAEMPLFNAAGQPLPDVLAILDGIRKHRAAFSLVEGRLTAPGQAPEHQKLLNELLADPRFEQLALAAYRNPAGAAQTAVLRGSER